jgi:arsenite methyltransferase
VISTSALHHLRDDAGLQAVFQRANTLLKPSGGFYMFDFGLLKSAQARQIFVAEVAKSAPPLTAEDYAHSLDAAFPLDLVLDLARQELRRPFSFARSALMDFFYFLQTPARTTCAANAGAYIDRIWRDLTPSMKMEHMTIRWFRRTTTVR